MFFEKRKLCGNHFIVAGSLWEGATRAARAARAREQQQQQRAAVAATRFESLTYKFAFSTLPISTRIAPEIAPSSSLRSPSPLSLPSPPLLSPQLPSPRLPLFSFDFLHARNVSRHRCSPRVVFLARPAVSHPFHRWLAQLSSRRRADLADRCFRAEEK